MKCWFYNALGLAVCTLQGFCRLCKGFCTGFGHLVSTACFISNSRFLERVLQSALQLILHQLQKCYGLRRFLGESHVSSMYSLRHLVWQRAWCLACCSLERRFLTSSCVSSIVSKSLHALLMHSSQAWFCVGGAGKQDMSPPRKRSRAATADNATNYPRPDHSGTSHKPRFMPDGGRAGQVTGSELAAELKAKAKKEAKQFAELGVQLTGRGADTVSMPSCSTSFFGDVLSICALTLSL